MLRRFDDSQSKLIMKHIYLVAATLVTALATGQSVAADKESAKTQGTDFFAPERLVRIEITIDKKSWDAIRGQTREFVPALTEDKPPRPFKYYRADIKIDGKEYKSVGLRKKGFIGSLSPVRPSLKVKFNEYQENGKHHGLDRLTLNNNKQDWSLVSQYLTYRLFRKAGVYAPRCNLCEVIVNGKHLGIYSNVESIKSPFLKRHFGSSKGALHEGTLADFYEDRLKRFQPKSKKKKRNKRAKKKMIHIARMLEQMKKSGKFDHSPLAHHLDVDNFLKFWAVESLVGFWDGYSSNQNNFYLYLNPKNNKFYFIPWGTDSAYTERSFMIFMDRYKSVNARGLLCNRIYADLKGRQKYLATLKEILDKHWNEKELLAEIDRIEKMVKGKTHRAQYAFQKDMNRKRKFIRERRGKILAETKKGPVKVTTEAGRPMYLAEKGTVSGQFTIDWTSSKFSGKASNFKINGKLARKDFVLKNASGVARATRPQPTGFGLPPRSLASVVLKGKRSSDGKQITLTLMFNGRVVDGSQLESPVNGQVKTGSGFFSGFSSETIYGHLTVSPKSKDSKSKSRTVKFDIHVYEMRGMFGKKRD